MRKTGFMIFMAVVCFAGMDQKVYASSTDFGLTYFEEDSSGSSVDLDYTGELDIFTGEPVGESGSIGPETNRIELEDGMYYDRTLGCYVYSTSGIDSTEIYASVADGMIVTEPVSITLPDGIGAVLYRNGNEVTGVDFSNITRFGRYILRIPYQGNEYEELFSFSIVGEATGLVSEYIMPSGFYITGAYCDGDPVDWSRGYISFNDEGEYMVDYECPKADLSFQLKTVIDHTPPVLALSEVENNLARGAVDISDLEDGVSISITRDGRQVEYTTKLRESGYYELVLVDPAGNTTSYNFTIMVYLDLNSFIVIGLVLLIIAVVAVYMMVVRKHLHVR